MTYVQAAVYFFMLRAIEFWWFLLVVGVVMVLAETRIKRKIPLGLAFLTLLLVTASLFKLIRMTDFEYYQELYQQLPPYLINIRYVLSLLGKLLGLFAGIGLFYRNQLSRKVVIILSVISICILPWKYPYFVFENIASITADGFASPPVPNHWYEVICYSLRDLVFSATFIWYLTRPKVKAFFLER